MQMTGASGKDALGGGRSRLARLPFTSTSPSRAIPPTSRCASGSSGLGHFCRRGGRRGAQPKTGAGGEGGRHLDGSHDPAMGGAAAGPPGQLAAAVVCPQGRRGCAARPAPSLDGRAKESSRNPAEAPAYSRSSAVNHAWAFSPPVCRFASKADSSIDLTFHPLAKVALISFFVTRRGPHPPGSFSLNASMK